MSIENSLDRIAKSLEELVKTMQQTVNPVVSVTPSPAAQTTPAAVPTQESIAPVVVPSAPATPAAVPAMAVPAAPFTTQQEMVQYIMAAYTELGPEKGAGIQNILSNLGYSNINDVIPEHYSSLYSGVESLKVA